MALKKGVRSSVFPKEIFNFMGFLNFENFIHIKERLLFSLFYLIVYKLPVKYRFYTVLFYIFTFILL